MKFEEKKYLIDQIDEAIVLLDEEDIYYEFNHNYLSFNFRDTATETYFELESIENIGELIKIINEELHNNNINYKIKPNEFPEIILNNYRINEKYQQNLEELLPESFSISSIDIRENGEIFIRIYIEDIDYNFKNKIDVTNGKLGIKDLEILINEMSKSKIISMKEYSREVKEFINSNINNFNDRKVLTPIDWKNLEKDIKENIFEEFPFRDKIEFISMNFHKYSQNLSFELGVDDISLGIYFIDLNNIEFGIDNLKCLKNEIEGLDGIIEQITPSMDYLYDYTKVTLKNGQLEVLQDQLNRIEGYENIKFIKELETLDYSRTVSLKLEELGFLDELENYTFDVMILGQEESMFELDNDTTRLNDVKIDELVGRVWNVLCKYNVTETVDILIKDSSLTCESGKFYKIYSIENNGYVFFDDEILEDNLNSLIEEVYDESLERYGEAKNEEEEESE